VDSSSTNKENLLSFPLQSLPRTSGSLACGIPPSSPFSEKSLSAYLAIKRYSPRGYTYIHAYIRGTWGSVVVKTLRCQSEGIAIEPQWCHWGFFSVATDGTMCPGVDSASKNKYQDTPGGKDGRCVGVMSLTPL
jgi:hypothetical protein